MPTCENCHSERLDITDNQPQRVYCVDCGSYAEGVTPSQVCLASAKEDIESAFEAWGRLEQISRLVYLANNRQLEREWAEDAKQRVDANLLRIEADCEQLRVAIAACKVAREALADLNGKVSLEVWRRLYSVTRQLDAALAHSTSEER